MSIGSIIGVLVFTFIAYTLGSVVLHDEIAEHNRKLQESQDDEA